MKRVSWCVLLPGLALSGAVAAATLEDFKEAVSKQGCESIPYESIRYDCDDRDVNEWCKNSSRKISCDGLDPRSIKTKIDNVNQKIANLKRERDELSSKANRATDEKESQSFEDRARARQNEIYELENKIERWESDLSSEKWAIDDRKYNGERCVAAREVIVKAFSDAKARAKSESDPLIKPYAERLISKWEAGEPGHATSIQNYKKSVEKCVAVALSVP